MKTKPVKFIKPEMHRSYKCSYRTEIGDGINAVMDIFGEDGREEGVAQLNRAVR